MSRDSSFMKMLMFIERKKDNIVEVNLDPDKTYPRLFSQQEHYNALGLGLFCFGLVILFTFFIR